MNTKELVLQIDKARYWAMQHQPFYSMLMADLGDTFGDNGSAVTDGVNIEWDAEYLEKLNDKQTRYLAIHESLHPGHQHLWRLPATEEGNLAADAALYFIMKNIPDIEPPPGIFIPPPEWEHLAEEEILPLIKLGKKGKQPPGSFTKPGKPQQKPGAPSAELSDLWKQRVVQAHLTTKMTRGDTPANMLRELERIAHQAIDWKSELSEFIRSNACARNDWTRSSRRNAWQSVIYPRKKKEPHTIVFAIDTSGSIDRTACSKFIGISESGCAEAKCRAIRIDCDASVNREQTLEPGQEWSYDAAGGGGTDFCPVFKRTSELLESGEPISGIVYLTDLDGSFPDDWNDSVPTLWLKYGHSETVAPFGRTVQIEN